MQPLDHFIESQFLPLFTEDLILKKVLQKTILNHLEGNVCLDLDALHEDEKNQFIDAISTSSESIISKSKEILSPFIFENNCLYLQKAHKAEVMFFEHLTRFTQSLCQDYASFFSENEELNFDQNEALKKALSKGMLILTGGPGTGKTYVAKKIARALLEVSKFSPKTIILAAPTSKACEMLKKSLDFIEKDVNVITCTLHKLCEFRQKKPVYLNGSCIIIDESSMIEAPLFAKFFSSLGSDAKVILMGDPNQLPPVGIGAFFQDLIENISSFKNINHVHLKETKRFSDEGLKKLCDLTLNFHEEHFLNFLKNDHQNIKVIHEPLNAFSSNLMKPLIEFYKGHDFFHHDLHALLKLHQKKIILSTLRQGPLGVDEINQKLHEYFYQKSLGFRYFLEPIIIEENDFSLGLMNGEIGFKIYDHELKKISYIIKGKLYENCLMPRLGTSYALSVHKSQGSEYDHVLFMVPTGSEKFSKEIVYTAITRVKKSLTLWFDKEPLLEALKKTSKRVSGLKKRVINQAHFC